MMLVLNSVFISIFLFASKFSKYNGRINLIPPKVFQVRGKRTNAESIHPERLIDAAQTGSKSSAITKLNNEKTILTNILAAASLSVMVNIMALPPCMAAIGADPSMGTVGKELANILAASTLSTMVRAVMLIPCISICIDF